MTEIVVGGVTRLSASDWPDHLVATVFCQGCPWRCRYCHNPHLVARRTEGGVAWAEVLAFLDGRRGLLDGVVFSGGEPTLQDGLAPAIADVRALGFRVGLHTGGSVPDRFAEVLPMLDWVGFDVKAPFDSYGPVTGDAGGGVRARESLGRLIASGVAYEVRTTVHPALLGRDELVRLLDDLAAMGVGTYAVQSFRSEGCADDALCRIPAVITADMRQAILDRFPNATFRIA